MDKAYAKDWEDVKYNIHSNAPDENKITRGAHHVLRHYRRPYLALITL